MWCLLFVAWADPPLPPLPALRPGWQFSEVRAGHAVVQAPPDRNGPEERPWFTPNAHLTAAAGWGGTALAVEGAVHVAVGRHAWASLDGTTDGVGDVVRWEHRLGVRLQLPAGFSVGPAVGLSLRPQWGFTTVAVGTLAWTGPGERIRPVIALEGRYGPRSIADVDCSPADQARPGPCVYAQNPAQTGLLANAGVKFGARVKRVTVGKRPTDGGG
jgi:hypothetical protein